MLCSDMKQVEDRKIPGNNIKYQGKQVICARERTNWVADVMSIKDFERSLFSRGMCACVCARTRLGQCV